MAQESDRKPHADAAGESRLTINVLAVWAGELIIVACGFMMPRLIDSHVGQERLGIWDFGWSLVSYLNLVQCGLGASVNRYVAKFRATGDHESVNCAVSSAWCAFLAVAAIVVILSAIIAFAVPGFLGARLGEHVREAEWVIFLLGLSLAVQVSFFTFGGVLMGCHRWGLFNATEAGSILLTTVGMISVLIFGGGLPALALVIVAGEASAAGARYVLARRVCPELRVGVSLARLSMAWNMVTFGGKTFVPAVARVILNQTASVLIVAYIGPAALALFSRPASLVKCVGSFVQKLGFVLVPTASAMQEMNREEHLRDLLLTGTRYAAFIALPAGLLIAIFGDPILRLWMGPRYEQGLVLAILALGNLPFFIQMPTMSILTGMALHGRPGVAYLVASIAAAGMGALALGVMGWGLPGAAVSVTLPMVIASGGYVPVYACRHIGLPLRRYLLESMLTPVLCAIPFAGVLLACRIAFSNSPLMSVACGTAAGGAVLLPLYWRYAMPSSIKQRLVRNRAPSAKPTNPVVVASEPPET
jgi:O-antigen/teichoic acid export membrane protein